MGPLLVFSGTQEGIGFALRRIFRLQSARNCFPNLSIEDGRVVLISEWGSANLEECLWDPSDLDAENYCMLIRGYLNPTPKKSTTKPRKNVIDYIAWAEANPEVSRETVRGSLQYYSYFPKLASCAVPNQNLAITSRLSFVDALLRRVLSADALTLLVASKTHAELGELAKHLAQTGRSEADCAVFQSRLARLSEDRAVYDAGAEGF